MTSSSLRHLALIGNYPPRQCGIATFTSDIRQAFIDAHPNVRITTFAMNDNDAAYDYSDDVTHHIRQHDRDAYIKAAELINNSDAQVLNIQHEFGIFGGDSGEYLLDIIKRVHIPIIITLHTVLTAPTDDQRRVMNALIQRADYLVVMAQKGREILQDVWQVKEKYIKVIPHGIPDMAYETSAKQKEAFDLKDHRTILTFGLLSPNKGLKLMIDALPDIVKHHPDIRYIILGKTHPHLIAHEGEAYRDSLKKHAEALGVLEHIVFIDQFVDMPLLKQWLIAADIYVTPYLNEEQITSGTLSYAAGLGKAIISTPYWHAVELLADDTGIIVPFGDAPALAKKCNYLLEHPHVREAHSKRAYNVSRSMVWSVIGERYGDIFSTAIAQGKRARFELDDIQPNISAIVRMSDDCGIVQHGKFLIPDRFHGYCLDDNARALMLLAQMRCDGYDLLDMERLYHIYAAFVNYAWNEEHCHFRNFMDYQRQWMESKGSIDSFGRALWALGVVVRCDIDRSLTLWATDMLRVAMDNIATMTSPRAVAFSTLGLLHYLRHYRDDARAKELVARNASHLQQIYHDNSKEGWHWFESVLSYDNPRLCEALLLSADYLNDNTMQDDAIHALTWLHNIQQNELHMFRPIGTESFNTHTLPAEPYDQQPLEAWAAIDAYKAAYICTQDTIWKERANTAFAWYHGDNDAGASLITDDGGCFDGINPSGVNRNQGAESLIAYQYAILSMRHFDAADNS